MKIYKKKNVLDATIPRFEYIFNEFEDVIVWISGGKDSTVIFDLAIKTAHKLGKIPLKVAFIDQESEWESTIEIIKDIMYREDVTPLWYQIPFKLNNSTSFQSEWLYCWDEKEKALWPREKDPISIKENHYDEEYFLQLFEAILDTDYPDTKMGNISGVRTQESPGRYAGLTGSPCYKWITWGRKYRNPKHRNFYPIYDWHTSDVWKYIWDNQLKYNRIYDLQYQYGVNTNNMRVSSLHHETSIRSLFYMQEAEPDNYNKLIKRMTGISSATHFGWDDFYIEKLPFMFSSWQEYRDYLLEHLIAKKYQKNFKRWFIRQDIEFKDLPEDVRKEYGTSTYENIVKSQINAILVNDFEGTKLHNIQVRNSTVKTREIAHQREKEKMKK